MPTEIATEQKESKASKLAKLFVKIAVTTICFWYISGKVNIAQAVDALQTANWTLLFLSVVAYMLSKLVSAYRLNIYFKNINLNLPQWQNVQLYWLGMFYNLFLPGSISGDAYKVVLLNRRLKAPYRKTGAAVLLDRFSGLLGLGVILAIYGGLVFSNKLYSGIMIGGCLLAIFTVYMIVRLFFKEFLPGFLPTFLGGIVVQAIQVAGVYLILSALNIKANREEWSFIFLSASVITILPLSLGGGLGTREVVFAEGATFFQLDPNTAVIISLLFYLSSVAGAVWGAWFVFHDPLDDSSNTKSVSGR